MTVDSQLFRKALQDILLERALLCADGSPQQTVRLAAAAALERGEKIPSGLADPFVPLAGQTAYGIAWMVAPIQARAAIVDLYVR